MCPPKNWYCAAFVYTAWRWLCVPLTDARVSGSFNASGNSTVLSSCVRYTVEPWTDVEWLGETPLLTTIDEVNVTLDVS